MVPTAAISGALCRLKECLSPLIFLDHCYDYLELTVKIMKLKGLIDDKIA